MSDIGPGDLVVCVDDSPPRAWRYLNMPARLVRGRLYRITASFLAPNSGPVVLVDGQPPVLASDGPTGWALERFRKIDRADESFTREVRACRLIHHRETIDA